ncbi:MAG: polysaccharide biosynthesis protein [Clostridiales bacterium]|nr:polysaccharide biosynthesis protein [Clostridiales bacterium]
MAKVNQLKWGTILSYLQSGLGILVGLIYTPFMVRLLGQSEYGLYNTVASTISTISILNLGFTNSYMRYYSKYKNDNDQENIAKLNGLFLIIFLILGFIAFACGMVLTINIRLVFSDGLTNAEYKIATVLMFLLTISIAISFPFSVVSTIIGAHEKFIFLKLISVLKTVGSPLLTLPLLLLGFRSIAIVVVSLSISFIVDTVLAIYVTKVLRCKFIFKDFEKGLFKSLFAFSAFIAINMIVDQINWSIDKFLLGRFKGTAAVAVYSAGSSLYNYYMKFSLAISGVFTPRIHNIVASTEDNQALQKEKISALFTKVGRIQFLILALVCTGLVFFGQAFINFWVGDGYEDSYYVTLLLSLPATIPLIQNLGIEIQRAKNLHRFRSIAYFIMAIINLVSTIFLCQYYGAVGAAIGTAASLIICNGIIMNVYYHKKCNIDILSFWKNILRMCLGLIIPIIVGVLIYNFIDLSNVLIMMLFILIYTIIYSLSMWFIGINNYEKDLIRKPFRKLFGKK